MGTKGFQACGIARTDRESFRKKKKHNSYKKLEKRQARTNIHNEIMVFQWQDKKTIKMVTTIHDNKMVTK